MQFKIGDIVRYSDGPSALMRLEHVAPWGGLYGEQYFGGSVMGLPDRCQPASPHDLASWRWAHDSNDEWVRGRYSYKPPTHVCLLIESPSGNIYTTRILSRHPSTYEKLLRMQGTRILGRWLIYPKGESNGETQCRSDDRMA